MVDVDIDNLALSWAEDCAAGLVSKLLAGRARSALGVDRDARDRTTVAGNVEDDGMRLAAGAPSDPRRKGRNARPEIEPPEDEKDDDDASPPRLSGGCVVFIHGKVVASPNVKVMHGAQRSCLHRLVRLGWRLSY